MSAKNFRSNLLFLGFALVLMAPAAWAQEGEDIHGKNDTNYNPTNAQLILPTNHDFAEVDGDDQKPGKTAGFGTDASFGASSNLQAGSITPAYRFSKALAVKLRVPYIFQRKVYYRTFGDEELEATASGLGDISFDIDYKPQLKSPGSKLKFSGTVKLPTGDHEKVHTDADGGEWGVPLGSGSVDFIGRATYARSTAKLGWITALMYRVNSAGETTIPWGTGTLTNKLTVGNQFAASAFGRYRVGKGFWAHLGASLMLVADGKNTQTRKDAAGNVTSETDSDYERAGTLVDLFPGLSYTLGPLNPYLGVRIPVVSTYTNDRIEADRQMSIVLQFSYNPLRLAEGM